MPNAFFDNCASAEMHGQHMDAEAKATDTAIDSIVKIGFDSVLSPAVNAEYSAILAHAEHDRHPTHIVCVQCAMFPSVEEFQARLIRALDFAMSQNVWYPVGQLQELQDLRGLLSRGKHL